jgi:acetylornithine deacetylase/succinyl-diaminopimelate desuccinylase-like protein
MQTLNRYIATHIDRFIRELSVLIQVPSIGTDGQYSTAMLKCAKLLSSYLQQIGFSRVNLLSNGNKPLVFTQKIINSQFPTVLIYSHYDVQPIEPLGQWAQNPFSGAVEKGRIWGRGASDNKGQLFAQLKGLEYLLKHSSKLPLNLKILIDSEEEIGSNRLCQLIRQKQDFLQADVALVSDTQMPHRGQPALHYALRGNISMELELKSSNPQLHSGIFGGMVQNPIEALAGILGSMHNDFGRIAIPGMYDQVRYLDQSERVYLKQGWEQEEKLQSAVGVSANWGEKGYTNYERTTIRPALTITGISGGYSGDGIKSVIPNQACAKLNLRLATGQKPEQIDELMRQFVTQKAPRSMRLSYQSQALAKAFEMSPQHPYLQLAADVLTKQFNKPPVFLRSGGTMPAISALSEAFKMPVVLAGFGLSEHNIHAPNENFDLENFQHAIGFNVQFLQQLSHFHHDH